MDISDYYVEQAKGLQGYSGSRIQKGHGIGSMFKSLAKWIIPIIKNYAEPVVHNAIKAGVSEISSGLAKFNDDINVQQKDIKESASQRLSETVQNIKNKILKGSGKRKKSKKSKLCKRFKTVFEEK